MSTVHVVVPAGVDDPSRPSGGNTYDRRVCAGLAGQGWVVHQREVAGSWPRPDDLSRTRLARVLTGIPDGTVVLLDGLVASALPGVLVPERRRLRLVVLLHLPLGHEPYTGAPVAGVPDQRTRERAVLHAAVAVVATSRWTREWLLSTYSLPPGKVHVVPPGVEPAPLMVSGGSGARLVCVGAVTPTKGQDVLVDALARVSELPWSCRCVGALDIDPAFAARVQDRVQGAGLGGRVAFTGPRVGGHLDAVYAMADLVLVPSRTETYGMVVTEALARGVPVVGSDVGGLPEALGETLGAARPGILVPPGRAAPLGAALRRWLTDATLRHALRLAARQRRATLGDWSATAHRLSRVLREVA
ncbi:MAG: glycosyltransferase family 4 protein [Dermatophilaceae bacterium]|nr:glycosyltransferase family 4 protein [Intrasporangiaceae bacterium]